MAIFFYRDSQRLLFTTQVSVLLLNPINFNLKLLTSFSCLGNQVLICVQKMSVPVPLSSLGHAPLQVSRSVPAYPRHSPGCPAHSETHHQVSGHRKLARSGLVTPGEMQRLQRVRRERARSASALVRPEPQQHGGKRRKQDHNRWGERSKYVWAIKSDIYKTLQECLQWRKRQSQCVILRDKSWRSYLRRNRQWLPRYWRGNWR